MSDSCNGYILLSFCVLCISQNGILQRNNEMVSASVLCVLRWHIRPMCPQMAHTSYVSSDGLRFRPVCLQLHFNGCLYNLYKCTSQNCSLRWQEEMVSASVCPGQPPTTPDTSFFSHRTINCIVAENGKCKTQQSILLNNCCQRLCRPFDLNVSHSAALHYCRCDQCPEN